MIEDVVIEGNRWVDCGLTAVPVTVQEHTQVTLRNNTEKNSRRGQLQSDRGGARRPHGKEE